MKRERRQPTKRELASITSRRPEARKIESSIRSENPTSPDARKFFGSNLTYDGEERKASERTMLAYLASLAPSEEEGSDAA